VGKKNQLRGGIWGGNAEKVYSGPKLPGERGKALKDWEGKMEEPLNGETEGNDHQRPFCEHASGDRVEKLGGTSSLAGPAEKKNSI